MTHPFHFPPLHFVLRRQTFYNILALCNIQYDTTMTGKMFPLGFWVSRNIHGAPSTCIVLSVFQGDKALLCHKKRVPSQLLLLVIVKYAMSYSLWIKKDLLLVAPVDVIGKKQDVSLEIDCWKNASIHEVCTNFSKSNHRTFDDRTMTKWSSADAAIFGWWLSIKMMHLNIILFVIIIIIYNIKNTMSSDC